MPAGPVAGQSPFSIVGIAQVIITPRILQLSGEVHQVTSVQAQRETTEFIHELKSSSKARTYGSVLVNYIVRTAQDIDERFNPHLRKISIDPAIKSKV